MTKTLFIISAVVYLVVSYVYDWCHAENLCRALSDKKEGFYKLPSGNYVKVTDKKGRDTIWAIWSPHYYIANERDRVLVPIFKKKTVIPDSVVADVQALSQLWDIERLRYRVSKVVLTFLILLIVSPIIALVFIFI